MENQSAPSTSSFDPCDTKGTVMSSENTKAGHKEEEKGMKAEREINNDDRKEGDEMEREEINSLMITDNTENEDDDTKKGNGRNVDASISSSREQQEQKQQTNGGAEAAAATTSTSTSTSTTIQGRKKRLINPSSMLPLRAALAELQKQKLRDSNNNNNKYYSPSSTLSSYSSQKKRRRSDYGSDGDIAIKPLQNRNNDTRDKANPNYADEDGRGTKNKGIEKRMERDEHIHVVKEKRRKKGDGSWDDVREALERKTEIYDKLHKQDDNSSNEEEEEKEGRKHDEYKINSQADPKQEKEDANIKDDKYLVDFRRKKEREHMGEKTQGRRRRMDESASEEWSRDRFHSEASNHGYYQYWNSHPSHVRPPPFHNDYDTYRSSRSWHSSGCSSSGNGTTSHHQYLKDDDCHHDHRRQRQRQDGPHHNHGRRRQDQEATDYFRGPGMVEIRDEFGRVIRVREDSTQHRTYLAEQARKARVEEIWRNRHAEEHHQRYGKRPRGERDACKLVDSTEGYGPRSRNGGRNNNDDDYYYYHSVRSENKVDSHCDGSDNKNDCDGDKTEKKPMDHRGKKEARLELLRKKREARERR